MCWMTPPPISEINSLVSSSVEMTRSSGNTLIDPETKLSLSGHPLALSSQHFKLAIIPDFTANCPADSGKMCAIKS